MGEILQQRLHTEARFGSGEQIMIALGLSTADLGAFPDTIFREHDLSRTQYNVLRMLRGAGTFGLLHGEITARLIVGVPDVTRLMDRLHGRGLVKRQRLKSDRRKVVHRITAGGVALLDQIGPKLDRFHQWLATALEPEAREDLVALCESLIEFAGRNSPWEDEQ